MPNLTSTAIRRLARLEPFPQPNVIPLRNPVVLMHGFGLLAFLAKGGHLHEEAMHLRVRGILAFAPNVSPYDTISERAVTWKSHIQEILSQTRHTKVHLIAHSMGGLDARYLISELGMHKHVLSLTTISSPHRGSSIADIVLEQPGKIKEWLNDAANWLGEQAMINGNADFHRAIENLTPSAMTEDFNPKVINHPDVIYRSFAGGAGKGTLHSINPILRPFNSIIYAREGINDGPVSVNSAIWGDYQGEIAADHAQQIGIDFMPSSNFSSNAFISDLIQDLSNQESGSTQP